MIDWISILFSLGSGVLLGLFYFGLLWWTVSKFPITKNPVVFYLSSLVIRTAILLVSLYLLLQIGAIEMLVGLTGFFLVRITLIRRINPSIGSSWLGLPAAANQANTAAGSHSNEASTNG